MLQVRVARVERDRQPAKTETVAQQDPELDRIEPWTGLRLLLLRVGMRRLLLNPHSVVMEPVRYCPGS